MTKYYSIILIISSFVLFSCKNAGDNPVSTIDPQIQNSFIPLAVGNKWVYIDSVITTQYGLHDTTSNILVKVDSVSIISKWTYKNYTLFGQNYSSIDILGWFGFSILVRNDSVFNARLLKTEDFRDSLEMELLYPMPPTQGEVDYGNGYYASMHKNKINTLVGIFDEYYLFAYESHDSTFVVPKVGVVKRVTDYMDTRLYPTRTRRITNLIRYNIVP
jgi:hypothetical protein